MKAPTTKREALATIVEMHKEIRELEEIVAGARLNEENLRDYLHEVCDMIHFEMSLKYQDKFVARMMEIGLYKPDYPEDIPEVIGTA